MSRTPTQRLYWDNARAKTALAVVTGHRAGGFTLDRTLYHAALPGYHHAQPCDLGHVLADGHKLKLTKVAWDRGELVHRTDGPLPALGAKAQLHLDAERRERQARAHAAGHLLVTAVAENHGAIIEPPHVVGGGEARLVARFRERAADALPKVMERLRALVEAREDVVTRWAPRDDVPKLASHEPVPLADIMPGEPTLRLAQVGKRSLLPCDAPLCAHTWEVGELKLGLVQQRSDAVKFGVKLVEK